MKLGSSFLPRVIPVPTCNVEQSELEIFLNSEDILLPPDKALLGAEGQGLFGPDLCCSLANATPLRHTH